MESYNGKTVWITGASSGIGREVALKMSERGARLILSARSEDQLKDLAAECESDALVLPMDVSEKENFDDVKDTIEEEFGGLDLALFNAGVYSRPSEAIESSAFEKDFQVNVMGIVYGMEAVLPLLRESPDGRIVAMSSASAFGPLPRASSYGASKTAVKYMVESMRLEWRHKEIDVDLTVVCPGFVKTPMTEENEFPMPFIVEVEDAAEIILRGIKNGKQEISFPNGLVIPLKLFNKLPAFLYNPLISWITGMA